MFFNNCEVLICHFSYKFFAKSKCEISRFMISFFNDQNKRCLFLITVFFCCISPHLSCTLFPFNVFLWYIIVCQFMIVITYMKSQRPLPIPIVSQYFPRMIVNILWDIFSLYLFHRIQVTLETQAWFLIFFV